MRRLIFVLTLMAVTLIVALLAVVYIRRAFIVNSQPLVYDSQKNRMDEEHPAKRKKSRWWPPRRGAMRIFAALIAVGALLFVFRSYYLETLRDRPLTVLGAATVVAAVVVLIRVGQHYEWTGFGEPVQPKPDTQEIRPRKTLWDWLQLFIVPFALAAIGLWFAAQQDFRQQQIEDQRAESEREIEDQRAESEREIEEQRAQDAALQAYLDQMSQLMLEGDLRGSEEGSEVRTLARARTQTVLARLDSRRKRTVVQFLYEASLLKKEHPVVSLSAVRLHGADLSHLDLNKANLSGADLTDANLSGADLSETDLSEAILREADLSWADLNGAEVSGATLNRADLSKTGLIGANLRGADLSETDLSGAILREADMGDGIYLFDADLRETDLTDANLSGAYLSGADLTDANLSGVNLSGANLSGAKGITEEQLEQAKTLEGATMPNRSIHD